MQRLGQKELEAEVQRGMPWPQLPLVWTQHESADWHTWEEAHRMLLVLKNLEANADMRKERA